LLGAADAISDVVDADAGLPFRACKGRLYPSDSDPDLDSATDDSGNSSPVS
jgi:hypothetical protein